jgi:hypothetical protein
MLDPIKRMKALFENSQIDNNYLPSMKIKLADNKPLTNDEFQRVSDICNVFAAISEAAGEEIISPPNGGVFWDKAKKGMGPFELYLRKNKREIEHLYLLYNAFRDFCALAYEHDEYTPAPDFWVRKYMRLARAMPKHWRVRIPARFGEIGWNIDGYPINRWTSVNQERINVISLAGITKHLESLKQPRILEIGAGAGEMGYVLCKALPQCSWYNCDLLGCLIYSAIQLTISLPKKKHYIYVGPLKLPSDINKRLIIRDPKVAAKCKNAIVYVPHFLLDDFSGHLDLNFAYNTYSFGEMPKQQVTHYTNLLDGFLKTFGILYEQNGYFPERGGDNAESIIETKFKKQNLPIPFDGRMLPNGPAHFWYNNEIGKTIQSNVTENEIAKLIDSFDEHGDTIDIQYPNKILWPKVYDLFTSSQSLQELYPW